MHFSTIAYLNHQPHNKVSPVLKGITFHIHYEYLNIIYAYSTEESLFQDFLEILEMMLPMILNFYKCFFVNASGQ